MKRIVGVGRYYGDFRDWDGPRWRSPHLPAPPIEAQPSGREGKPGWVLIGEEDVPEIVGVGTNHQHQPVWRSRPDLPAPSIEAQPSGMAGKPGWVLTSEGSEGVAEQDEGEGAPPQQIVGVGRYKGVSGDFGPRWQSPDLPAPTIMAGTHQEGKPGWVMVGRENASGVGAAPGSVDVAGLSGDPGGSKPPYQIPTMAEVMAAPDNGLRVASLFTGAGGTCLGFRQAGFRTVWASEFVPAAAETYRANFPGVPVDSRDVRTVRPEEILEAIGMKAGELDVLEGSPPCASFSTAGKRSKHWGEVKTYSDVRQRTDDLFLEYARILRGLMPRAFVAENVSGLVKGVAKGYFKEILAELKGCGYRVAAKLLDAQWLGVPQQRQRLIFVGVRSDLGLAPAFPRPLPYRYSVREALPWVASVANEGHGWYEGGGIDVARPAPTVGASCGGAAYNAHEVEEVVGLTAKRHGPNSGRPAPLSVDRPAPTVGTRGSGSLYGHEVEVRRVGHTEHVGEDVAPTIRGYAIGREWDNLHQGEGSDRYLNLTRSHQDRPCPTVTALGGQGGGVASVTHPTEKRKFTINELRRICGFPADFALTGSYSQQWERLGRAVPPPMARAVAEALAGVLLHGSVET
jgi:DNA (cytosine-5)-methyltransferase 1